MTDTIAVVSGGLDSVTMAHLLADQGAALTLVSFDYGQRHRRELDCASACAVHLDVPWHLIDLTTVGAHLEHSALTDPNVEVPDGHYTDESMRATVVPNRNMMMLAIAGAIAVAKGAPLVATAVHAGDHAIYPDCRKPFIDALTVALRLANDNPRLTITAPFISADKADIVRIGDTLGVPWDRTWSCYRGGKRHCGRCGTCTERREAFEVAGVADPTDYDTAPVAP